ncbi:hypothetical protein P154DRAFT_430562 [Amniculicola lignicola CBS 123094]|uniref:Uncharacterized protein n=1 Tax=Amniculicola lignicola CBS 123094 TaxID=1392246 RepID=A0A6A5WLA4_9PLEO|nr:hypothetical protein P154DRAFT_430562 [Amniculicola lignicola CBS 123094]
MFEVLHMAMPWYAAIPTGAFLLRAFLVSTMGSWSRQSATRYIALTPLRSAMSVQIQAEIVSRRNYKSLKEVDKAVRTMTKQRSKELHQRWSCSLTRQIGWSIAQLPIFLSMAEVLRRMCGTQTGLLGMVMEAAGFEKYVSRQEQALLDDQNTIAPDATNPLIHENNIFFDPTLAQEGMFWFPDLMVPDPSGALPFVVSALMVTNVFHSTSRRSTGANALPKSTKLTRNIMLFVALLIGPLTQHMPAAVLLYWASSTSSVLVWNTWLDRRYPVPIGQGKCKRPLAAETPKTRGA